MATTPINPFVVQVVFQGVTYHTRIIPLLNGKDAPENPELVDLLNRAQAANQLFSKKIEEMLGHIENYSVETHGYLTEGSAHGFTFENFSVKHKPTDELWKNFVNILHKPAEHMSPTQAPMGPGARIEIKPNTYLNLSSPEDQKKARLGLFTKKCWDYFSQQEGAVLPHGYKELEYTSEEKGYLEYLYTQLKHPKKPPSKEIWFLMSNANPDEQIEMARILQQIQIDLKLRENSKAI